ncbi:MAG: hypothetical protein Q8L24_02820, partial [bacterium]|nr:hypothetical protein [bacterium]
FILLQQLDRHPDLKAVGAHPVPIHYAGRSPKKWIGDKVFNCRSYFPMSEVAVNFAPEFHPYAVTDPQIGYAGFETRSKIYFHARCFALRDHSVWDAPDGIVGDDTYLDRSIHYRFGPGSIRVMFDAVVRYKTITSFREFSRTSYRVYRDLKDLRISHPHFDKVREFSKTRLDWSYIRTIPFLWRLSFCAFYVIRQVYRFFFKHGLIYSEKSAAQIWSYDIK